MCSDIVKLWSALVMAIVLMLTVSADWSVIRIILVCSVGGVFLFFASYLIMILLLGIIDIDVVDKQQYDEWKEHGRQGKMRRLFSYALYSGILTFAALISGVSFADYHQDWSGIIFEWILFGSMGFLVAQIIMRILFLSFNITTDKGDIEDMAHEIERRRAEKKELKKRQKAARRRRNIRLYRAWLAGMGFGAGWGMFHSGSDDAGQ